jgi:hypothetical protein
MRRQTLLAPTLFLWAGLVAAPAFTQSAPPTHTPPEQWREPRNYETPFDPAFDGNLILSREAAGRAFKLQVPSPNGAYWFGVDPDWPEHPAVACGGADFEIKDEDASFAVFTERSDLLRVTLKRHYSNFIIRVRWVNERLLYVQVWWGRALGSCYLLDVEAEKVVHREMVRSGEIPFQQAHEGQKK